MLDHAISQLYSHSGGVDFVLVKIDLTDVQGWYKAAFLPGDAPAMCGTPGGIEGEGWVGGSKECRERAAAAHPGVARANEVRSPVREEEVIRLGEALKRFSHHQSAPSV